MRKKSNVNSFAIKGRTLWLYTKFQLVSKLIIAMIIVPVFRLIADILIHTSGRTNLSSGDFIPFLKTPSGVGMIVLGILVIIIIIGVDINAFIVISSLIEENKLKMKIKDVLLIGLKSIKLFFSPAGVILAVFIALILPLVGIGINATPFKDFHIPNFITSAIENSMLYSTLYGTALFVLTILSLIYIFTLQYAVIENQKIGDALKNSKKLMKKHWKEFLKKYILNLFVHFLKYFIMVAVIFIILTLLTRQFATGTVSYDGWVIFSVLVLAEFVAFFVLISVPYAVSVVTKLFYEFNREDGIEIRAKFLHKAVELTDDEKSAKIRIKTKIQVVSFLVLVLIFNIGFSVLGATQFKEIFMKPIKVQIVAHRAGGDLGAENSIEGVKQAINTKANWVEIDVQRTKDNKYIINHDNTFSRVAGVGKRAKDMTYSEIKKIKIKDLFDESRADQPVATLDEILDVAKNKIGVFIELKGETADEKMVDDVVKDIKSKGMMNSTVLLSLDYNLIKYIVQKYPDVKTGYLYYFNTGSFKNLEGDYLIMEEREATPENIDAVHLAGKKAFVWTVNTPESIEKFIHSDADGIITDHVKLVQEEIRKSNERTHIDIIIDSVLGED